MDAPAGISPAEIVAHIAAGGQRYTSPCGDGQMVWHVWGEGPPLVLLHGGFGSWMHWIRNVLPLSLHYTVIAADLPGLGDSDEAPHPYTAESLAEIVAAGIDARVPAGQHYHLVGFSFGGLLGGHIAGLPGSRAASLTLVGPGGLGLRRGPNPDLRNWRRAKTDAERAVIQRHNLAAFMIADPARVDDLAVHVQIENTRRGRTKSRPIAVTDTLAQALPRVTVPITGIWGDRDVTAAPYFEERQALLQAVQPDSVFHLIEGAGHWVQYEAAEQFNALLLSRLEQIQLH